LGARADAALARDLHAASLRGERTLGLGAENCRLHGANNWRRADRAVNPTGARRRPEFAGEWWC